MRSTRFMPTNFMNMFDVQDTFKENDKVLCIDDSSDRGPFGYFPNHLKKGLVYTVLSVNQLNVRGEVICVVG